MVPGTILSAFHALTVITVCKKGHHCTYLPVGKLKHRGPKDLASSLAAIKCQTWDLAQATQLQSRALDYLVTLSSCKINHQDFNEEHVLSSQVIGGTSVVKQGMKDAAASHSWLLICACPMDTMEQNYDPQ